MGSHPLSILAQWAQEAEDKGLSSPRTFTFTTATPDGTPHSRTVLSTVIDSHTIRFHSSSPTTKTLDLAANPRACGVFFWPDLGRQAIIHGTAHELSADVSTEAFPTRPRQLQLVALAYEDVFAAHGIDTSQPTGRQKTPSSQLPTTAAHIADLYAQHDQGGTAQLVRPQSWTTIEFTPHRIDLWQGVGPELAAHKTRFDLDNQHWTSVDILP